MNPLRKRFAEAIARAYRRAVPGYPPGDDARLGESLLATMRKDARQRLTEAGETITVELTPEQFFAVFEALEELPHLRRSLANADSSLHQLESVIEEARRKFQDPAGGDQSERTRALPHWLPGVWTGKDGKRYRRLPGGTEPHEVVAYFENLCGLRYSSADGQPLCKDPDTGESRTPMERKAAIRRTARRFFDDSGVKKCRQYLEHHNAKGVKKT